MTCNHTATLPETCQSASAFIQIMESIWDKGRHELYDDWHDANRVARYYGKSKNRNAVRGKNTPERQAGYLYAFDDGTRIFVYKDGSGIEDAGPIHFAKKRS